MSYDAPKEGRHAGEDSAADHEQLTAWSDLGVGERRAALGGKLQLLADALSNRQFLRECFARVGNSTHLEQDTGDERPHALYQALSGAIAAQGWRVTEFERHSLALPTYIAYSDGLCDWERQRLWIRKNDRLHMLITLIHEDAHRRLGHRPERRMQQSEHYDAFLDLEIKQQIDDEECQAEASAYLVTEYFGVDSTEAVTYLAHLSKVEQRLPSYAGNILDTALGIIDCIEP